MVTIIKKYPNLKFYDTKKHCYIGLSDIYNMVKNKEELIIFNQKTKIDITAETLIYAIIDSYEKSEKHIKVGTLVDIILNN